MTFGGSTAAVMSLDCLSDLEVQPAGRSRTGVARDLLSQPGAQNHKVAGRGIEVSYGDNLPPWFANTIQALMEVLELKPGWDGHSARAINPNVARDALDLMFSVMDHRTPSPSIVPTYRGYLQLEWHRNGIDLEIEILPGRRVHLAFEDRETGREIDRELTTDLSPLTDCVAELSSRQ